MTQPKCSLVLLLGEAEEAVPVADVLADLDHYKAQIDLDYGYGALKVGDFLSPGDRMVQFVSKLARAVSYVIEGEPETVLWSESEHGVTIEAGEDEAVLSFFAGDPYEPDQLLLPETTVALASICDDFLKMGEQLCALARAADPGAVEESDLLGGLVGFVELGRDALKTYKLEKQRGLR